MTALYLLAAVALVALAAWRRLRAAYWRRRAEREWAATCARVPWRVAAVLDGGPLVLALGDDALRLWWEDEGRAKYPGVAAMERNDNDSTRGQRP